MEKLYLNKEGMERFLSNLKNIFSLKSHSHTKSDITDFPSSLPANGGNSSTVNGHTVNSDVPSNAKFTDTNTWRGIQNNLTSDSTTDSLSAAQGKALKALVDGKTSNTGTITGIKMNGTSKGTSGVVDLGTVLTSGKQTTTSTADGGSNVYTFSDNSTITVKNGTKGTNGTNGTSAAWFTGTVVTGTSTTATVFTVSGSKVGDMYLNTSTYNVYRASAANSWVYVCNIKGATGSNGKDGTNATTTAVATTSANGLMSKDMVTKLNGIATGANAYTHPTTSGNKHIPSGGSSGQILRWSSDGTAVWGSDNNTTYSNFVKSGSGAKAGLVPAPSTTAGTTKYLREDGTWVVPPNTTYSKLSQFTNDKSYICEIIASSEPTNQSVGDHWMQTY